MPSETQAAITVSNLVDSTFTAQFLLVMSRAVSAIICVELRKNAHISVSVKRFNQTDAENITLPASLGSAYL